MSTPIEKKEAKEDWIRQLAGNTPLRQLATKVPQGLRKEVLLDTLFNSNVPLSRATWLVFCSLPYIDAVVVLTRNGCYLQVHSYYILESDEG
jgi:hypothetical protein